MDLDLVAGEVAEVRDERGLLGQHRHHRLCAFEGLLAVVVRDTGAVRRAGGGGEEGLRSVGDAQHGAPLSGTSGQGQQDLKY